MIEVNEIVEIITTNKEEYELITDLLRKLDIEWSEAPLRRIIIHK